MMNTYSWTLGRGLHLLSEYSFKAATMCLIESDIADTLREEHQKSRLRRPNKKRLGNIDDYCITVFLNLHQDTGPPLAFLGIQRKLMKCPLILPARIRKNHAV